MTHIKVKNNHSDLVVIYNCLQIHVQEAKHTREQDKLVVRPTRRAPEEGSGLGPPLEVSWDTCLGVVLTPATIKDPTQAGGGAMAGVTDGVQDGEIAIPVPGVQDGIVALQEQHTPQEGVGSVPAPAALEPGLLQDLEGRGGDRYLL